MTKQILLKSGGRTMTTSPCLPVQGDLEKRWRWAWSIIFFCKICQRKQFVWKNGYRNPTGFRRWVKVAKSGGLCYTCVMGTWKSKNSHKYLLQYHKIFVCKYRKNLLTSKQISDDRKQFSYEIYQRHKVVMKYMETDKDHIHDMIEMLRKYIENQG